MLQKKPRSPGSYPAYSPYDSNQGWHGEWFYIRNPVEASFLTFIEGRPVKRESWTWGPSRQQKKLAIIELELQKLVRNGLDGLWAFHTFFHRRVAPLGERTWPMWEYSGPMDPNHASLEELSKDKVWSYLGRAL